MKKIISLVFAVLYLFTLNSCREDGDWGNDNESQFGFTIERDNNFIEKAVGETNQLKFNIKPSYDFASIKTSFKFTTNLNGTLKLNGKNLSANTEYTFESKENVFEYIGNVAGTHDLKISVKNDKGTSKEEEFELKYSVSDFAHTFTGGTAPIYQGDETQYLMKITPSSGQPASGYQIKFNTYSGAVKLNGVAAQIGQYYPLPNIENFSVTTATNQAGDGALFYTIKNSTVTKDYSIQQNVIKRQITIESMNINATTVSPNTAMSLIGVVKKTPVTGNITVQYKTWISSASNNNTTGIQNTNNVYIPYTLGSSVNFTYNMNAIETGSYTYNIQFKDEYGNESKVKTFNVEVGVPLTFIGEQNAKLSIIKGRLSNGKSNSFNTRGFFKSFKVEANPEKIMSIEYNLSYSFSGSPKVQNLIVLINSQNSVEYINDFSEAFSLLGWASSENPITDAIMKIKVNANNGTSVEKTVNMTVEYQ